MCGIGGILRVWPADQREVALRTPHERSIPEELLNILDDSIKHRGPDGHGRFRDRAVRADGCVVDVAFVHRRLSIIDHAGGHQPMVLSLPRYQGARSASSGSSSPIPGRILSVEDVTAHNRCVLAEAHAAPEANGADPELALGALQSTDLIAVVFNGCIYNHRELRAELQRAGHVFNTDHSDTEVLVHGWREWGRELPKWLEGMFSLAIWDRQRAELFIARDRAGEKPLYYLLADSDLYNGGNPLAPGCLNVAVCSTAAGIASLPQWSIDPRSMANDSINDLLDLSFLRLLEHGYQRDGGRFPAMPGVRRLEPGERAWFSPAFAYPAALQWSSPSEEHRWGRSTYWELPTKRQMPLDGDYVEMLLDLSIRTRLEADAPLACFLSGGVDSSLIARFAAQYSDKLRTFCVRMPDGRYDESKFANEVADHLGLQHETLDCPAGGAADLEMLITRLGLPLGDSSLLPTYWVSKAVSKHAKVVLTGDGGDELFCGYERYAAAPTLRRWHRLIAMIPAELFSDRDPRSRTAKVRRFVMAAKYGDSYISDVFGGPELRAVLGTERFGRLRDKHPWLDRKFFADDLPYNDARSYLPHDLLVKVDTASMAVPLECRAPMLSSELMHTALGASLDSLMPNGQRKGLLRQVARKYLPAEIVDRPKMGFAIPIGEWFRSDYGGLRTMLLDHLNSTEPFGPPSLGIELNMKFVRQMLDQHLGTGPSGMVKRDHSQRLYMLLVLSIWAKWVGGLR